MQAASYNAQFLYWQSPSIGELQVGGFSYTVPAEGETVTAYYANATTAQTTTSTVTTTSTTSANNHVSITVTTNPTSQGIISVDGFTIDTPQVYYWVIGSQHYLFAPATAPGIDCDGCQYQFVYWLSVSGRETPYNTFLYTVPPFTETVTAFYALIPTTSTTMSSTTTASTP